MPQAQTSNPLFSMMVPLVLIYVIFYFLFIRPQRAKEKEHQKMLSNLNKNDEIITAGGIHGTIVNVKDKTLIIRVDDNVKIEIEKTSVANKIGIQKTN